VCATLPFSFEGKRRGRQAQDALAAIQQYADAVICFENDRMGELIPAESGIHEAFAGADQIISQCVRAVIELVNRRGLIRLGFDDLLTALRSHDSRCLFGYGAASGPGRGKEALTQALKSPLMDGGSLLGSAANILVNIVGGSDLTLYEVQNVMEDLAGHIGERTQLLFGAAVDPKLEGRLGVTLISSLSARSMVGDVAQTHSHGGQQVASTLGEQPMAARATTAAASSVAPDLRASKRQDTPAPTLSPPVSATSGRSVVAGAGLGVSSGRAASTAQGAVPAEHLSASPQQRDVVSTGPEIAPAVRGRFDKSQPTISEDGEDLDVPTFLRKNFKLR